jgi:proteic killer suppression protein
VIRSFRDKGLRRFAEDPSKLRVQRPDEIARVLTLLDEAATPVELNLPGLRLHELTGDRRGTCSVTITGNWRITFGWEGADAIDVDLEDYH